MGVLLMFMVLAVLVRLNTVRHRTFWISCWWWWWWWWWWTSLWLYCNTCWLWFWLWRFWKKSCEELDGRLWRCSVGAYFAKMQLECLLPWGSTLASGFELLVPFSTLVGFDTRPVFDSTTSCQETVADCHIVVKNIQLHVALLQQVEGHAWKSETRSNKRMFNYICMCCNQEFTRNLYP